jgi:hypothetical protein
MKSYLSAGDLPLIRDRKPAIASPPLDAFPGMDSADRAPREEILHRAYAIWQSEGQPDNRKLANWLEAEAEVMGRGGK